MASQQLNTKTTYVEFPEVTTFEGGVNFPAGEPIFNMSSQVCLPTIRTSTSNFGQGADRTCRVYRVGKLITYTGYAQWTNRAGAGGSENVYIELDPNPFENFTAQKHVSVFHSPAINLAQYEEVEGRIDITSGQIAMRKRNFNTTTYTPLLSGNLLESGAFFFQGTGIVNDIPPLP